MSTTTTQTPTPNTMPLSKATRFEVFKRDKFTCQYCGKKAPDVVLECDHIHPRAQGGGNDPVNLLAACHACNNGKGARTLSDDSVVAKQHAQLAQLQERREQLEMMMEWQRGLVDLDGEAAQAIASLFADLVPGWSLTDDGVADVKRALTAYSIEEVSTILRETVAKHLHTEGGVVTEQSGQAILNSFFNELKYRKQREKNPTGSALRYIFGIVRNRSHGLGDSRAKTCKELLQNAHANGATVEQLKAIAVRCDDWNDWVTDMYCNTNPYAPGGR